MEEDARTQKSQPQAGQGCDVAFAELYKGYYTRVFAFMYSRVGNVELSKDLTGEIFERAYVKRHTVREPAAYGAWLFMIARNVVIGHYRRHRRDANVIDRFKDSLWLIEGSPDPEARAILDERSASLMRHFHTLSRRDQELLSLKFDAELTYPEIAQVMGMKEGSVRVSVFRALQRLRYRVQREKGESDEELAGLAFGLDRQPCPLGTPQGVQVGRMRPRATT